MYLRWFWVFVKCSRVGQWFHVNSPCKAPPQSYTQRQTAAAFRYLCKSSWGSSNPQNSYPSFIKLRAQNPNISPTLFSKWDICFRVVHCVQGGITPIASVCGHGHDQFSIFTIDFHRKSLTLFHKFLLYFCILLYTHEALTMQRKQLDHCPSCKIGLVL